MTNFYPPQARVPEEARTERLLLRPLTTAHNPLDYDAVMASREQLRAWSQTSWPSDDFTPAENRADLARHQREHEDRLEFTYTVLEPTETRCLGCVYLTPIPEGAAHLFPDAGYGVNVGFWIRSDEMANGLDSHLLSTLRAWFAADWLFDRVIFTVSQKNPAQAALLQSAGLARRTEITLTDGRPCWVYTE